MGDAAFTIEPVQQDGVRRLLVAGRLLLADGHRLWQGLGDALRGDRVDIDLSGVSLLDGGSAALLLAASARARGNGVDVRIVGADGEAARLLDLYGCGDPTACGFVPPRRRGMLDQIGSSVLDALRTLQQTLAFTGDLVVGVVRAVRRPRSVHLGDLGRLMENAGADGVPIVTIILFLVGAILGLQGAIQLHRFAADDLLAHLVGLSVVRELGPLMTAIVVAGRSGAAYAAELGTMTVGEEIDALRTLGQDPQRFLVFPRVLALVVVVPILTLFADVVGCVGGLFVAMVELHTPPVVYLRQLQHALDFADVATGVLKSAAFAALIGLVACQRGLATRGGAQGVGASTTSAVVVVLFGLVALDALFTLLFTTLGW